MFMVRLGNPDAHRKKRVLGVHLADHSQGVGTDLGVGLHDIELFRCQLAKVGGDVYTCYAAQVDPMLDLLDGEHPKAKDQG